MYANSKRGELVGGEPTGLTVQSPVGWAGWEMLLTAATRAAGLNEAIGNISRTEIMIML